MGWIGRLLCKVGWHQGAWCLREFEYWQAHSKPDYFAVSRAAQGYNGRCMVDPPEGHRHWCNYCGRWIPQGEE